MRRSTIVLLAAGLCASASWGMDPDPKQPASAPAADSAPKETMKEPPVPPAAPAELPVPNLPVIETKTLPGGLIVEEMKIGEGTPVPEGGSVVAHYHGTLKADPTKVFDSSFKRGAPIAFPLSGVIEGWQKGVPGMKQGGIRRLTIPAAMAYGERSPSPDIPANSDLVFVIQLVDAVQIEEVKAGEGEAANRQFVAVTTHTITSIDGQELEKAVKPFVWFPGEYPAMSAAIDGMKPGGKRKVKIPKDFAMGPTGGTSDHPTGQACVIEVELITVRNLPQQRR